MTVALLAGGLVVGAIGAIRARRPWGRYQALKAQEQNIARYEAWRGGLRDDGPTGASVAIEMLRRELQLDAVLIGAGVVGIVAGLLVR